ncbi:alkyl/aryl-sulfatase [Actinospica robiniae]|uniref:alkyl/aryl-sulfatase n=1 Tax=Actinospica robiniae TaxID=304901 RepID=UPI00041C9C93|nr:alkyl sulfatase dimerization domain-containing protein [Actinospica robiniae]
MAACQSKPPSPATTIVNRDAAERYELADRTDFALADRGLIAPFAERLYDRAGQVIFDPAVFDFLADDAPCPESVDPSLWRQSQLVRKGGLYRVVDGLYQVRGNDIANLTVVEGETGLVVIDCMASVEAASQGMAMIREHVSDKPVVAVVYTHTHVDHYGGVKGVVELEDVASGKVPILAPGTLASFDRLAIRENVIAGNAMSRRAAYAFGSLLEIGPAGHLTCGIGVATVPGVTVSYISPTDSITATGTKRKLAGLQFEFLYAPDTEAPEEMHIWLPELKALTCAENANHTLHNIQTLRGARTRDARSFARYLDETLELWGDEAWVHYGPHTWPVWGNEAVVDLIASQRDAYKYVHDQALRMANQGFTPLEAAEEIELPEELGRAWHNRGYHGTLHHDVRAVFTKELGTWDGDPVSLHPHPPVATAERFVALIGADRIMAEGERALETGDYRWAAQLLHLLVFADPENQPARLLQADAYEQMGYQAEGPQWRGIFLSAAKELRGGLEPLPFATASPDTILAMPVEILFDFAAVHLNGPRAARAEVRIDFVFTDAAEDRDKRWRMWVRRGVLNARRGTDPDAQLTVTGARPALVAALLQPAEAEKLAAAGQLVLAGDEAALTAYGALLDGFDPDFNIVTP